MVIIGVPDLADSLDFDRSVVSVRSCYAKRSGALDLCCIERGLAPDAQNLLE